jgi:hypothetical protein
MNCRTPLVNTDGGEIQPNPGLCPRCQRPIRLNQKFCINCGNNLIQSSIVKDPNQTVKINSSVGLSGIPANNENSIRYCGFCGAELKLNAKFCVKCGQNAPDPKERTKIEEIEAPTTITKFTPNPDPKSSPKPPPTQAEEIKSQEISKKELISPQLEKQEMELEQKILNGLKAELDRQFQQILDAQKKFAVETQNKIQISEQNEEELRKRIREELYPIIRAELEAEMNAKIQKIQAEYDNLRKSAQNIIIKQQNEAKEFQIKLERELRAEYEQKWLNSIQSNPFPTPQAVKLMEPDKNAIETPQSEPRPVENIENRIEPEETKEMPEEIDLSNANEVNSHSEPRKKEMEPL